MSTQGWVGFDFDGTLARYETWAAQGNELGEPVWPMVDRLLEYRRQGRDVRIMTARVAPQREGHDAERQRALIEQWCMTYLGFVLPITPCKDYAMELLYDDRVVAVEANTGKVLGGPGVAGWE